eukprot:8222813-Ditylum_brightwellii.AAC.1
MKTAGYWQLCANTGMWMLEIAKNSCGTDIFHMVDGTVQDGRIKMTGKSTTSTKRLAMKDFVNHGEMLLVKQNSGFEQAKLYSSTDVEIQSSEDK